MKEAKLGFYQTDYETLFAHLKHSDTILNLKRRWLLGLSLSKSEHKKFSKYGVPSFLPESLVRDDDIFYENLKEYVAEIFGERSSQREFHVIQDSNRELDRAKIKRMLLLRLDALTNGGLYLIAKLITGGLVNFERTRKKMKKVIKESIRNLSRDQSHGERKIFMQLSRLLNSSQYFREDCLADLDFTSQSHKSAASTILDKIEDLPSEALLAVRRKLRGAPATIPCLQKRKQGYSRDSLIHDIRKISEEMLSELGERDELQAPMAKALATAGLSLKLTKGCLNSSITDFDQFSPPIKALQNEILKAIWLVKRKKVRLPELKSLQLLLNPMADLPSRSLRTTMKKFLTEYLFECNELDTIPASFSEALAIINRSSCRIRSGCYLKEEMEEEVECVLALSSEIKQTVWDVFPDVHVDEDFTDAYVEELEETYDGDDDDGDFAIDHQYAGAVGNFGNCQLMELRKPQNGRSYSIDLDYQEESSGECMPPVSTPERNGSSSFHGIKIQNGMHNLYNNQVDAESVGKLGASSISGNNFSPCYSTNGSSNGHPKSRDKSEKGTSMDPDLTTPAFCFKGRRFMSSQQSKNDNLYLGIQEICDETSMVAYNLIGYILEELAQQEGLDLDQGDVLYLRGDKSGKESKEERNISEQNAAGSDLVQVVEELLPSLPESESKKLRELMGI